jgi:carbonic anhydrase
VSIIDEALSANATIADDYDAGRGKPPAPRIAIVTCADPRLTGIARMLGLADGDVDMIRNVGTVIDDDSVRSLIVSTRVLGTREIMIINHNDCGMSKFADSELEDRLRDSTGMAPIAPPASTASPTSSRTRGSRSRRPGPTHGSHRTSRSGDSCTTSTAGGSPKCSRRERPSLASNGAARRHPVHRRPL